MALLEDVFLPTYQYSNFNRSKKWRSTMRPGLLYPCLFERVLPGTMVKMSARSILQTVQLQAPLMGSFRLQIDSFWVPLRLYNLKMRLNSQDFDRDSLLPLYTPMNQIYDSDNGYTIYPTSNNSLLNYIGVPAYWWNGPISINYTSTINGVGILAYYDIFRNFYVNQQEDNFYINISNSNLSKVARTNLDTAFENFLTDTTRSPGTAVNSFLEDISTYFATTNVFGNDAGGLLTRTYQSDMNSCFLSSATYNSINTVSSVDTSSGSFTMNQLLIADKLFDSYNQEMVSGSHYSDFMKSQYAVKLNLDSSAPTLLMSNSANLWFETVVSTATTEDQPLGELAGRGQGKLDGDSCSFVADEVGYVMSIASIVPAVDYYQGMDPLLSDRYFSDYMIPSFDNIGFQPLSKSQLYCYADMTWSWGGGNCSFESGTASAFRTFHGSYTTSDGETFYDSWDVQPSQSLPVMEGTAVGYQPAWTDYMSNYSTIHGDFVDTLRYWTLGRSFAQVITSSTTGDRSVSFNPTTYIDPTLYNFAFADIDNSADNFFVQIGWDLLFNSPISKRVMPHL